MGDEEDREPTNREWALEQLSTHAGWRCEKLAREEDLPNLFMFFDGLATPAAMKRKEEILAMLRWKYATDPFFSISSKVKIRLAADGSCQVVCQSSVGGDGVPEILCSTRPVEVPMVTTLGKKQGGHVFDAERIATLVLEEMKARSVVAVDVEILFPVTSDEVGCLASLKSYLGILRALCDGHDHPEQYYFKTWPRASHNESCSAASWDGDDVDLLRGTHAHMLVTSGQVQLDAVSEIVERVIAETYGAPLALEKTQCSSVRDLFRYVVLTFESRAFSEAHDEELDHRGGQTTAEDGATDLVAARQQAAPDTEAGKAPDAVDVLQMLAGLGKAPEVKRRGRVCVPLVDLFDGAATGRHNATTQRNLLDGVNVITMTTTKKIAAGSDIFNAYGPNGGATMLFKYGFVPYNSGKHDGGPSLDGTVVCPSTAVYDGLDHLQQYGLELKGYTKERICTYGWALGDPHASDEPPMFSKFATLVLASENPEIFDMDEELPKHRVGASMLRLLRDQLALYPTTAKHDLDALEHDALTEPQANATKVRLLERNVIHRWATRIYDAYDCDDDEMDAFLAAAPEDSNPCQHCGWALKTVLCSRCKAAPFCSNACLKAAWKDHKPHCKKPPKT